MNHEHYRLVFSVADCGYKAWWFPAMGLLFICIGIFALPVLSRMSRPQWSPEASAVFQLCWICFTILWTIVAFVTTFRDYWDARSTLNDGTAGYVAGVVQNFVPMPQEGHADEHFLVNGVGFSYSDFEISAGFNNTSSHGGPIHEGLPVHIWYMNIGNGRNNEILKLEIAEN